MYGTVKGARVFRRNCGQENGRTPEVVSAYNASNRRPVRSQEPQITHFANSRII
jgi:hypothetical protein